VTRSRWLAFGIIAVGTATIAFAFAALVHFKWSNVLGYGWLPFNALILLMLVLKARPYRIGQAIGAILINANIVIFFQHRDLVYTGFLKRIPQPILNCYFGPLSVFACPIGSMQQLIGIHVVPWIIIAFFIIVGVVVGRMACGWACAFGLWQDLLEKIPVGPRAGNKRWISFGVFAGLTAAIAVALILFVKLIWWQVFLLAWLPVTLLVLLIAIKGKMDIPARMWLGGFLASLALGVFVWFKFEPALGIVVGAIAMALFSLTGRWPAAIMAGLAGIVFSVLGPAWKLGPLSGVLLGITVAVTLVALVVVLDKLIHATLPSTFLKFGYLVIIAGIVSFQTHSPWFCKLCPQGTLEAGIPQILWNVRPDIALRSQVFWLYWVKVGLLLITLVAAIGIRRPFCRLICPIGATYSVFNKFSLLHLAVNDKCKTCRLCEKVCPMDIEVHKGANQLECIRCLECKYHCNPDSVQVKF
jgi:ferredoxin